MRGKKGNSLEFSAPANCIHHQLTATRYTPPLCVHTAAEVSQKHFSVKGLLLCGEILLFFLPF